MALFTLSLPCHLVARVVASDPMMTGSLPPQFHGKADRLQRGRRRPCPCATLSESGEYYAHRQPTPLLDTVNCPIHMKNLSLKELNQLADELSSDVIFHVSKTGGNLGSSLGVVELTVALHYVFNAPQYKILWDVGHQVTPIFKRIPCFFFATHKPETLEQLFADVSAQDTDG